MLRSILRAVFGGQVLRCEKLISGREWDGAFRRRVYSSGRLLFTLRDAAASEFTVCLSNHLSGAEAAAEGDKHEMGDGKMPINAKAPLLI